MTKRRSVPVAMIAALALAVAGCGGSSDDGEGGASEDAIRVGLVADKGQLNDRGFNQLAYEGLQRAEDELGVEGRVVESASAADYIPNMSSLARQGYDLVIGVGFAQGDAIAQVAQRFPDTKFAIVDVDQSSLKGKPANVEGLAALEARRKGATAVSAVGGYKEPPVDRFIAGYRKGALSVAPELAVLYAYSSDWDDQAKCKELALDQIAQGSAVVFQVAGGCGLGALSAAKDRKVWGIGVDADQSFLGPHVLTSALKGVDTAVYLTIESVQKGSFAGGTNAVFGLDQAGVGLGSVSPDADEEAVDQVEDLEEKIVAGEIADIPTTLGN